MSPLSGRRLAVRIGRHCAGSFRNLLTRIVGRLLRVGVVRSVRQGVKQNGAGEPLLGAGSPKGEVGIIV